MLKKLRVKFIALNMATVAVVLIVVFTAICVIDHQQSVARVHEALNNAVSHAEGRNIFPDSPLANSASDAQGTEPGVTVGDATSAEPGATVGDATSTDPDATVGDAAPTQELMPPEIGGKQGGSEAVIPVATYAIATDGTLTAVSEHTTASIADEVLAEASSALADAPEGTGTLDALGLFYNKRTVGSTTYVAFADMSAARGWQALALSLAGVGLAALAVFFVISLFFSRWALRPVAQAWQQQQQFVADASHDLKTPLTVILANTSILLEHPECSVASQSQWVESTQREAEEMQNLVGDLLLLAQLDEPTATPSFESLDISDLVEGELLQFESVAFERSIELQSHVDACVTVQGNAARLRRLVATLLDNACKYADGGGCVTVTLEQHIKYVEFSVHNTGTPIPAEDLPHVFDRFYRADKARTDGESGHGLGLAIARTIAEEHGGTLSVESSEEAGTTFTATLPLG